MSKLAQSLALSSIVTVFGGIAPGFPEGQGLGEQGDVHPSHSGFLSSPQAGINKG